jgi:hypothetical protein
MMDKDLKRTLGIALKKMDEITYKENEEHSKYFPETLFAYVIFLAAKGHPAGLIHYLRADDSPLSFDRKRLATLLEKDLQTRRRGGRHHDMWVHRFAARALRLFDIWHEENIRHGVNDRGRCNYMKDETARIVFEEQMDLIAPFLSILLGEPVPWRAPNPAPWSPAQVAHLLQFVGLPANFEAVHETIRDLMDRPTARLKDRF